MKNELIYLPIDEITPYENNPRDNELAVDGVAESIEKYGFDSPIIVDENKIIINGHTRLKAAQKLGMEEVPVIIKTELTEPQKKAYRLADNKLAEKSTWDENLLMSEIEDLMNEGEEIVGFEQEEIDALFAHFDYDETGDLEDYENPDDEAERDEVYLKCPHCGTIAEKIKFEKASKDGSEKIDLENPEIRFTNVEEVDGKSEDMNVWRME